MDDNDKRQEKIEKLKERLNNLAVSKANIRRVAGEYLNIQDGEIRELMEDYLFLKPFRDKPGLSIWDWNYNIVNIILKVWEENIPENLVSRLLEKMGNHSRGKVCLFSCRKFRDIILSDDELREGILRDIEEKKDFSLAQGYIFDILDYGRSEGPGRTAQKDRCLQVFVKNAPERARAVDTVIALWSTFSQEKKLEYADMLFESDHNGRTAAYLLERFPYDDPCDDEPIVRKAMDLMFGAERIYLEDILDALRNYRMPGEAKVRFVEMMAENSGRIESSPPNGNREDYDWNCWMRELAGITHHLPPEARRLYVRTVAELSPSDTVPGLFLYASLEAFRENIDILMPHIDTLGAPESKKARLKVMNWREKAAELAKRLFMPDGGRVLAIFGSSTRGWDSLIDKAVLGKDDPDISDIGHFMSNVLSVVNKRRSINESLDAGRKIMGYAEKFLSERNDRQSLALVKDFLNKTCRNILNSTDNDTRLTAERVFDLVASMENELAPSAQEDGGRGRRKRAMEEFFSPDIVL